MENQEKDINKEIKSSISNVTIFLDGARVTRTSEEISLDKGMNILRIGGISKLMDSDSVRVQGSGKEIKATLVDVEVNYVYKEITGHKELDALYERLEQLEKEKKSLEQQMNHTNWINENFKTIIGNFTTEFPKYFAAGESKMENLISISDYSNETISNLQGKKFELYEKIEKNSLEIEKVNKEIQKIGGQAQKVEEYYDIVVSIEAENPGSFELNLIYQIKGANWTPSYDVLITENETTINYRAEVVNKTLENWENIDLEVSTATFKPVRIIEPQPWYIQKKVYYPPAPPKMARRTSEKKKRKLEEAKIADIIVPTTGKELETGPIDMEITQASFSEDSFGVEHYKIPKKMTIMADGNPHPVLLK
ncbi:MAG: mucoidy inhibitor MuiA family protein, partial [Candidatus Helarchaeota archaeon]